MCHIPRRCSCQHTRAHRMMTSYCIIDKHPINTELSTANVFCWPSLGRKRRKNVITLDDDDASALACACARAVASLPRGFAALIAASQRAVETQTNLALGVLSEQVRLRQILVIAEIKQTTNPLSLSIYSKSHIQTDPRQKQSPNDCKFYDKTYQSQKKKLL